MFVGGAELIAACLTATDAAVLTLHLAKQCGKSYSVSAQPVSILGEIWII